MGLLKVGITGGIGSGKSTVASVLRSLGAAVYNSDSRARLLQENDPGVVRAIKDIFGEQAYLQDGRLDSSHIAPIVFSDREMLDKLNAAVHPAVKRDFEAWVRQREKEGQAPYLVKEAAILIESGLSEKLDKIVVVIAPEDIRIARVVARDGTDPGEVRRRMESQMSDAGRAAHADYIVVADDEQLLLPQVLALHGELSAVAAAKG